MGASFGASRALVRFSATVSCVMSHGRLAQDAEVGLTCVAFYLARGSSMNRLGPASISLKTTEMYLLSPLSQTKSSST
eukprot:705995-Amorphochlora_amoeboformis.AAC.1